MEMAIPPSDIKFALNPTIFITINVTNSESGKASNTTKLPRILLNNKYNMMRTRRAPSIRALFTVLTLAFTISLLS